ncbi:MAG: hypothetical protein ACTSSA_12065 [Candidatus Freyarchaeota archaeon]
MQKKDVAAQVGVRPSTITGWLKDEDFKALIKQYEQEIMSEFKEQIEVEQDRVRRKLMEYAEPALDTLFELMISAQSERVRQISAQDILDRAGYVKKQQIDMDTEITVPLEMWQNIQTALKELKEDENE